jgi:iron complex transport system ATP-binding protein
MIEARDIEQAYGSRTILDHVSLSVVTGELLGLVGPNGSGKSTLLRCLHRSLVPHSGSVHVEGRALTELSLRDIARLMSAVSQTPPIVDDITVSDFVMLGRIPHRRDHQSFTSDDAAAVGRALVRVGAEDLAYRAMVELSGGERQRVAIARCLAQATPVLLLDEPTNHLDVRYQHEVLELVRCLRLTTVVVLHDLNLAAQYCDRVAVLADQQIVAIGPPSEVLVPDLLTTVYGIPVRRLIDGDDMFFAFTPLKRE